MRWRGASSESSEAGTQVALRSGPTPAGETRRLGLRERSRLRRRVRFLRKRRELELRDLGGLIFDMYRFGSKRQDLVRDKLQEMFAADRELREFEHLLGKRPRRLDIREAGVGGACPRCQQLYSTEARFCSRCGQALSDGARPGIVVEPRTVAEPPPAYAPTPEPAFESASQPEPPAWPGFEPQADTAEEKDAGGRRRSFGRRRRKEPEPQPAHPWQGAASQTQAWPAAQAQTPPPPPPPAPAWEAPEPPAPAPQVPAWQSAAPQPQAVEADDEKGGRRSRRRRLRKSPTQGDHAAEEVRRQQQEWEAQYQASVEAQRQAWQEEESRPAEPEPQTQAWRGEPPASPSEPGSDGADSTRPQPAAPTEGGSSGLEAGDPLASHSGDQQR